MASFFLRTGSWESDGIAFAHVRSQATRDGVEVVAIPIVGGGYRVDVIAPPPDDGTSPNAPAFAMSPPRPDRGCTRCKADVPAHPVTFRVVVGLLVLARYGFIRGNLCRRCAVRAFVLAQVITVLVGSLSLLAILIVPIAVTRNVKELLPTRWLPDRYDASSRTPSVRVLTIVASMLGALAVILAGVAAWIAPSLAASNDWDLRVRLLFVAALTAVLASLVGPAAFIAHHAILARRVPVRTRPAPSPYR
jgi:hypothetical protein